MTYLIAHMAIFLVFAQLLGLLLGWLIWGYVSRQRGMEVQVLRERLAEMHLVSARAATTIERHMPVLAESQNVLIEGDLPDAESVHRSFFEEEAGEAEEPLALPAKVSPLPPVTLDLETEVKDSKIQHLEQQVRELESARDRSLVLQADLSEALSARREAEGRLESAKNDFEVRSSSLVAQIRDFERAAQEWESQREELERSDVAKEKELATVKAHLRDLQNSQMPQMAEPLGATPSAAALELADLRERHRTAVRERDSVTAELEFWKQHDGPQAGDSNHLTRLAELEEANRTKDSALAEQVARIESLLWRVAELEPFAAASPQIEENLRRQESEIAGHMAMHAESAEQIRSLEKQIAELQSETTAGQALQKRLQEAHTSHQAEIQQLSEEHARSLGGLQEALEQKQDEIAQHLAGQSENTKRIFTLEKQVSELQAAKAAGEILKKQAKDHARNLEALQQALEKKQQEIDRQAAAKEQQDKQMAGLQARIAELESAGQRVAALEKTINERDAEIRGLLSAHGDMHREMTGWKDYSAQMQPVVARVPELEVTVKERETEIARLQEAHNQKDDQLKSMQQQLDALSASLATHQQQLLELQPLAARVPEVEEQLSRQTEEARNQVRAVEDKHQQELTRLKVNSAQRLRKLRQGITTFKG